MQPDDKSGTDPVSVPPAADPTAVGPPPPPPPPPGQPPTAGQPGPRPATPGQPGSGQPFSSAHTPFYTPYGYVQPRRPTNGLAIASLVVSIAAVPAACIFYGIPGVIGAGGAVMGHYARNQIRDSGEDGDGLALAGIIIGWIMTGIAVLAALAIAAFITLIVVSNP